MRAAVYTCFEYQSALLRNEQKFTNRFDQVPVFRGAIDMGAVTVIEVGDVKRQIVYHGDVLNTAARLLELCKRNDNTLVVSDAVGQVMARDENIQTIWSKEVTLRGKRETVIAHALQHRDIANTNSQSEINRTRPLDLNVNK
jgi:adenylate cyclase